MAGLRLIVGLGNPGSEYLRTRHNVGFWFVDAFAQSEAVRFSAESKLHAELVSVTIGGAALRMMRPATFMNNSGRAVAAALHYYRIDSEEMLVVHDDLDLPPGTARLKFDGGHGGQNGLRDIITHLGHGRFHRLRIGIGHPGHRDRVTPWVLGRPSATDEQAMIDAIGSAMDILPLAVAGQFDEAMKRLHTSREPGNGKGES